MVHVKESDDFLEDWVEEKLEEGIEKQRLKKVLSERDRDPEIVDEVASPFESEGELSEEEIDDAETDEDEESKDGFVSKFLS